jgi:hypothetical protein
MNSSGSATYRRSPSRSRRSRSPSVSFGNNLLLRAANLAPEPGWRAYRSKALERSHLMALSQAARRRVYLRPPRSPRRYIVRGHSASHRSSPPRSRIPLVGSQNNLLISTLEFRRLKKAAKERAAQLRRNLINLSGRIRETRNNHIRRILLENSERITNAILNANRNYRNYRRNYRESRATYRGTRRR